MLIYDSWTRNVVIRRTSKVCFTPCTRMNVTGLELLPDTKEIVATFLYSLSEIGYTLTPRFLGVLRTIAVEQLRSVTSTLVTDLKELAGVNKKFKPMYPNFPEQVINASSLELATNATIHYLSAFLQDIGATDEVWLPEYQVLGRKILDEKCTFKVLDCTNEHLAAEISKQIICSNVSLSQQDRDDLFLLARSGVGFSGIERIPFRENIAIVTAICLNKDRKIGMRRFFTNPVDVLRLAMFMSGGDVSLSKPSKFRNFKRYERDALMMYLAHSLSDASKANEMLRHREMWLRLGEKIHPRAFKKYANAVAAFDALRNKKLTSSNSEIEQLYKDGNVVNLLFKLQSKPGEFARHLNRLLKNYDQNLVISIFAQVVKRVPTPLLLVLQSHFEKRRDYRVFLPKGVLAKVYVTGQTQEPMDQERTHRLLTLIHGALLERFKALPLMGKVYIDPMIRGVMIPKSQRNATSQSRIIPRGSTFKISKNTVRLFVWWCEKGNRVDVDLSSAFLDENWEFVGEVAYFNLKSTGCVHSGDRTSAPAPDGASEFIDVDIARIREKNPKARYMVTYINCFTGQDYSQFKCTGGWMEREHPMSGEIFDPRTVINSFDLTSKSTAMIPLLVDLVSKEVIWCDWSTNTAKSGSDIQNARKYIEYMGKAIKNMPLVEFDTLMHYHILSRNGEIVNTPEEADFKVMLDGGDLSPFNTERIAAEFMA